jgi:hypothetical protein
MYAYSPYVCLGLYNYSADFDAVFLWDRMIQEECLYVYNIHNIVEKHFAGMYA